MPNALRVARDTVARTAMGSKSAEERIKETRASIAAAKASMEAQKRVEQVPNLLPDASPFVPLGLPLFHALCFCLSAGPPS